MRPRRASRGRTARGKRVPGTEINVQIVQAIKKLWINSIFIEFVYSLRSSRYCDGFSID
ncbi:hypothetical protein [Peribacillus simplex]|uniref:hypothetical protein n=1 Tax=Peribacillus simplex TaxID=1478 RepID=UPI003D2850CC